MRPVDMPVVLGVTCPALKALTSGSGGMPGRLGHCDKAYRRPQTLARTTMPAIEVLIPGRGPARTNRTNVSARMVSATRTGDAALSKSEDAAEVQLSSCPGAQPIQSGAPSRHEADLQAETLCCLGRVARSRGIDRRSRDGGRPAYRRASVTLTPPCCDYHQLLVPGHFAAPHRGRVTRKGSAFAFHPEE